MLVDPRERQEVTSTGLLQGGASLALSLLLHCTVLLLSPALLPLIAAPRSDDNVITLELLNSIRQRIRRENPEAAGSAGQNVPSVEEQPANLDAAAGRPERIAADSGVDLSRVRAIRSAIYSLWEEGNPPEQGRALVLLHIDGNGYVVQTWIRALEGEQGFQEYMQAFLDALSLPESEGEELWLECEFVVR